MGTHLRELGESYPMNTNMTVLRKFSSVLVLWKEVDSIGKNKKPIYHERYLQQPAYIEA